MSRSIVALAVIGLIGCRYQMDPVPLHGDPFELRMMAGSWVGEYTGVESGRSGTIGFKISTNADSAFGNVILTARTEPVLVPDAPGQPPALSLDPRDVHLGTPPWIQGLTIRFVRVAGGLVRGAMQPYRVPDCRCLVHTAFVGQVVGDTIAGTYVTMLNDNEQQQGTWRVTRMKP